MADHHLSAALPQFKKLNLAQRSAATHRDGSLLLLAGAGVGKTQTLVARVTCLIDRGISPSRILLLTFTRRSAAEMLARVGQFVGVATANQVWGGTFHAIANRLLRIYGRAIGLSPDFTISDQGDAADMMALIRQDLGLAEGDRRFPRKQTLGAIYSRLVNSQQMLDIVLPKHFAWCVNDKDEIAAIFDEYIARKRKQNVLDYDDLLLLWNALLSAPSTGDRLAARFDHVLVDEYQDTNLVQAEILRNLRRSNNNIMVVGDDAQSIYSFRAASVRNILDFPKQFPGTTIIKLEQNYRSTQPILALTNAIMREANEGFRKSLWSNRHSEQKPILVRCQDEAEQADAVCDNILAHLEQGIPLIRQAVLFRAGYHSDVLEVELAHRNIPFRKFGGLRFIEAAHIKDMLALLRIVENPYGEMSWFRVLQLLDGIGPVHARRMMNALGVTHGRHDEHEATPNVSPLQRLVSDPPVVPKAAQIQFDELRNALADCRGWTAEEAAIPPASEAHVLSVASQVERLRKFYEPILERAYENAAMRLQDIEQLEQIATRYRSRGRFITDLTLDPPDSTSDLAHPSRDEEDWLTLSTIHSAKGKEWDVVHVIHAVDGMIPSSRAIDEDNGGLEEERRVFYVAITRARDWLYLYYPLRYYRYRPDVSDAHGYAQLTRFLPATVCEALEQRVCQPRNGPGQEPTDHEMEVSNLDDRLRKLWLGSQTEAAE